MALLFVLYLEIARSPIRQDAMPEPVGNHVCFAVAHGIAWALAIGKHLGFAATILGSGYWGRRGGGPEGDDLGPGFSLVSRSEKCKTTAR